MIVRLVLPEQVVARAEALAPLARRAAVVRRLVEIGLERAEARPEDLLRPRPIATTNKERK